jgi:hypothetical protein
MESVVSLESALARIQEIQTGLALVQPKPTYTAPAGDSSFAATLQDAMAPGSAGGTASPTFGKAAPGQYPHLDGDLDAKPELLQRLEALAAKRGEHFTITSGLRTYAEQMRLWNGRGSNPYPVARPGTSRHESGRAADVMIGGRDIQSVISAAELRSAGLNPLAGDSVHVELP